MGNRCQRAYSMDHGLMWHGGQVSDGYVMDHGLTSEAYVMD